MKKIVGTPMITLLTIFLFVSSFTSLPSRQLQPNYHKIDFTTELKSWTSLYYIDADTANPVWNIIANLDVLEHKFRSELASGDNLTILVLQDKIRGPAILYHIDAHHNKTILEELGEVNMGDQDTLIDFITYGKTYFPSERYQLCLWGHANAWYGVCPDDTNGRDPLTPNELHEALNKTSGVDLLCFIGCCQMGSFEVVYELREECDAYIASEDDGYGPHWYGMVDDMCALLNNHTHLSTIECADEIIQLIGNNENEFEHELTISAMRTDKVTDLYNAMKALCLFLQDNEDRFYENLKSARNQTKDYDFIQNSFLLDLYDFLDTYQTIETDPTVLYLLRSIQLNLSDAIIAERHGENQDNSHGLSIFYSTNEMISTYANYSLDFTENIYWDELLDEHKEKKNSMLINDSLQTFLIKKPYDFSVL